MIHRGAAICAGLLLAAACGKTDDDASVIRGRGLQPARLSAESEARIYEQAIRAAFDLGPDLVLLMHPLRLSRRAGDSSGGPLPSGVVAALRARGIARGSCAPQRESPHDTPRCAFPVAGYVIRGSEVLGVRGDTSEIYLSAERFGPANGAKPEALRFEKVYQLVPDGGSWRVAREARVHDQP